MDQSKNLRDLISEDEAAREKNRQDTKAQAWNGKASITQEIISSIQK